MSIRLSLEGIDLDEDNASAQSVNTAQCEQVPPQPASTHP